MDKRTTGIIATVATVLLCGFPGLVGLCFGAFFALVGMIPGSDIDIFGRNNPRSAIGFGIFLLCFSIIFIAIPVVVGVLTLRNKSKENVIEPDTGARVVPEVDAEPAVKPEVISEPPSEEQTEPDEGASEDLPDPLG
jgi:hypothetical protein